MKQFQENILCEQEHLDNLLHHLRLYYQSVRTKRQLNMEVPAGFWQSSVRTQNLKHYYSLKHNTESYTVNNLDSSLPDTDLQLLSTLNSSDSSAVSDTILPLTTPESSTHNHPVSIMRSVDKPSSSLPNVITMSEDYLRSSLGFHRIDTIKQQFSMLYNSTVHLDRSPPDSVLDPGDFATIRRSAQNTTPVPRSSFFGKVMHADIVFGPEVALGNIHYGLLFSDRFSKMNYVYPLRNLTTDIQKQMEAFFAHIGILPQRLISDFDLKLIGGRAREYLNSLLIHVNSAPASRQDKNGLVERHWQTMLAMARNWLVSAQLPGTFWFYAIRHAAEVCNYFPYKLEDGAFTTPFQLVHKAKPDLRVLFPTFGLAAVHHERVGTTLLINLKHKVFS